MCSFVNRVTEQLTGTLSLGAAVFASVLFASGMPSEFDVVSCHASKETSAAGTVCRTVGGHVGHTVCAVKHTADS
jgi:hypothetical protein